MVHYFKNWHACATGRFGRWGSERRFMVVTFLDTAVGITDLADERRRSKFRVKMRIGIRILITISSPSRATMISEPLTLLKPQSWQEFNSMSSGIRTSHLPFARIRNLRGYSRM